MKNKKESQFWNNPQNIELFNSLPPSNYWQKFLMTIPDRFGKKALDLGCGAGRHTKLLSTMGYDVYACDKHPGMIRQTKVSLQMIGWPEYKVKKRVTRQSMENLSYPKEYFDLVICHGVYHNTSDFKMLNKSISESSRVLKKGGQLLFNLFTDEFKPKDLKILDKKNFLYCTKEGLRMLLVSPNKFLDLTARYGLIPLSKKQFAHYRSNVFTGERSVFRGVLFKK